jgi:alkylation response protein AidB-like acyl-CoA dehydrogenase
MERGPALAKAQKIATAARTHADETEAGHRLAKPVVDAIDASGLTTITLPTALGGDETHPSVFAEVVETIAIGDASAGWCAGINIGCNTIMALLDPTAGKSLLPDPHKGGMGGFAPSGQLSRHKGSYRVTGRWPFASNCHQAVYGAVGVMHFEDGAPKMGPAGPVTGMVFVPADDFVIDETWDMVGMRGTGSHDVVVDDVDVDDAFVTDLFAPVKCDDALYRMRMFDILGPSLGVVPLGIGRAALNAACEHIELHGDAPQRGPKPPFGVDVAGQMAFAEADRRLRSTRGFLFDNLDEAYSHALRGDRPPREVSARIGLAVIESLAAGTHAVDVASRLVGSSASRDGAYLDRLRRDVLSAGAHVMFSPGFAAPLGRQAAGMHTVAWPYLPPED